MNIRASARLLTCAGVVLMVLPTGLIKNSRTADRPEFTGYGAYNLSTNWRVGRKRQVGSGNLLLGCALVHGSASTFFRTAHGALPIQLRKLGARVGYNLRQ